MLSNSPGRICAALTSGFFSWLGAGLSPGDITYTLHFTPSSSGQAQQVANSVAAAASFYNQNGSFNKHWNVYYNAGIPTAEGNIDGYMGYGGTRNERVVFHEAAHTFGMGTTSAYSSLISGGVWKGVHGNRAQLDTYNDYADGLHGDGHAIWPGGYNYDNEDGFIERYWHTRVMAGMRADLGFLSFTGEAVHEAVVAGGTAEFRVESPRAASWQWTRNGTNLTNGGDISGARSPVLRIANVEAADAGTFRCTVTGASETLSSRPRQLQVHAAPLVGQWNFNGSAVDSASALNGTAVGGPGFVAGKIGQAVDLDGADDYIDLPDAVGRLGDLTMAAWVNWDGGNNWQRIFDFGTGTWQYFFLSPKSGSGTMRLGMKDAVNGRDVEYQVNAPVLATGQWVHLAAVLGGSTMTLYVNGKAAGIAFEVEGHPAAWPATNNYIGKSQFPDPGFNGRVDDFRIYSKALTGAEIWSLWGQSTNQAPAFSAPVVSLPAVSTLQPYIGQTLASLASDPEGQALTFTKLYGPVWLNVAANGALSGQPGPADVGLNTFAVRVTDPSGGGSDATLQMQVTGPATAPVTASATAPVRDADDAFFLPGNVAETATIGGSTNAAGNDESTYSAVDRTSKGQTFTTGSHPRGYQFHSFTLQHMNWPSLTAPGTSYDLQPGDRWEVQVGTITGVTRSPILTYPASFDGAALTGSGNTGTGRFLTFNLSGLGLTLAPNTAYYFMLAPLSGSPFLELNSAGAGTANYAGGSAIRGTVAGALGSGSLLLNGDFAFHARLEAQTEIPPATVVYWNFEEGPVNSYASYGRPLAGQYEGGIVDRSGNGNHLSVWGANWHWYRSQIPAGSTPRTGAVNVLSLQNAGNFPALSAPGTDLISWSPAAWTIEAAIRPDDATSAGFQTFIGRDSIGAAAADPALAAFYLAVTPTGALRVVFTDVAGNNWAVTSAANAIQDAKWHAVAATSDGSVLSLYRKNITNGDASYTLLGSTSLTGSADPALSTGLGDGTDWDAGVFTVARGLYNGGHTDRFFGHVDDIRFSNGALAPADFLYSAAPPTPAQAWRQIHFGTVNNAGNAADNADPDMDGVVNLMERALGGNPAQPDSSNLPSVVPAPASLTLRYTRAKGYTDLLFTVQESTDDSLGSWIEASGTTSVSDLGDKELVQFTVPAGPAGRKFLRLKVSLLP